MYETRVKRDASADSLIASLENVTLRRNDKFEEISQQVFTQPKLWSDSSYEWNVPKNILIALLLSVDTTAYLGTSNE